MHPIQTQRLLLSEASLEDAEFIFNLLNSKNWLQFIGDRGVYSKTDAERYIQNTLLSSYQERGFGLFKVCLKQRQTPIGLCGFIKRPYLDSVDIGFAILPDFEGKGYTFEAASATITYGIEKLGLQPILGITTEENIKSRNLLGKLGMHEIGKIDPPDSSAEFLLFSLVGK